MPTDGDNHASRQDKPGQARTSRLSFSVAIFIFVRSAYVRRRVFLPSARSCYNMPPQSRKSYTAKFKLSAVEYATEHGNRAAGRRFDVTEKMIRTWRQSSTKLQAMKSGKKADRGKKARWPELEDRLVKWALEQRAEGRALSTVQLRLKARTLASGMGAADFVGGPSWCYRFMRRKALSIRARTTMCQKLPDDFGEKVEKFQEFVKKEVEKSNIIDSHIVNMDEVPLTFDIPMSKSVAQKGAKAVTVRTTGHEKSHFTVVLACCADGTKLPPMLIFKRKTMPKESFPPGVVVKTNEKGWMDEQMMGVWLETCFSKRPDGFFHARKGLLVMDSMRAHMTDLTLRQIKTMNCTPTIIPGGMTKILQPLDISVNRSFKAVLRRIWEAWMTEGEHSYTATGRMRRASFSEVAKWVHEAWSAVSAATITAGFRKAGLLASAPPQHDDDDNDLSDSECEETVAAELPPEIAELFDSASEDEDFAGFE